MKTKDAPPLVLTYTNHRGETGVRRIIPLAAPWWGQTDWHPEPQWLLRAFDVDRQAEREFALKNFGPPECAAANAKLRDAWEAGRNAGAKIADPPLMHRKGAPGLWRRRRADIAVTIRRLQPPADLCNDASASVGRDDGQ